MACNLEKPIIPAQKYVIKNSKNSATCHTLIEVDGNCLLEDYFGHLSQNGINFLSCQVLLLGLNRNEKSRGGEVIDTHVFDHVPGRL